MLQHTFYLVLVSIAIAMVHGWILAHRVVSSWLAKYMCIEYRRMHKHIYTYGMHRNCTAAQLHTHKRARHWSNENETQVQDALDVCTAHATRCIWRGTREQTKCNANMTIDDSAAAATQRQCDS